MREACFKRSRSFRTPHFRAQENDMELKILTEIDKLFYKDEIIQLLEESDNDFLPPLSRRGSPNDKAFLGENNGSNGVLSYYTEMNRQPILAAFSENKIVGFVSFREDNRDGENSSIYVSTLVVAKAARGQGLTRGMYDYLSSTAFPEHAFRTRTWSTNAAHIKILSRFGFHETKRLENDRGAGIDTVYYERPATVRR